MMTAFNGARIGQWTINRQLLLLALLAPVALTGCPGTTPSNGDPTAGDPVPGAGDNVAPNPLLDTLDGTLAEGDTLQGQVGIAISFNAAGSVDSDGIITAYEWDFGDGSPLETEASVTHSYAEPGEYTVTLTVIDDDAERTTLTITVMISGADPVASFTAAPTSGQAPLTVEFDASASSDASGGSIIRYTWDPGDGSGPFGGTTLSHTYQTGGTFTATLTIDDEDGHSGSMSIDLEVQAANQIPLAVLTATPLTGFEPLTVEFDASASSDPDGTIETYAWDYGDGSDLEPGALTSHDYTTAGTYTAELTVTDNDGATASTPVEIIVEITNLTPTAMIGADPTTGSIPLTVTFDADGSSDPEDGTADLKYLWDFGESTCVDSGGTNLLIACTGDTDCPSDATCNAITATDTPTPVHTYDVQGLYTATLTVYDNANLSSETVTIDIEVTALDVVSLAVDTTCLQLDPTEPAETYALLVTGTLGDDSELDLTDEADTLYTSDDLTESIITVSDDGLITAVDDGAATVTVSRTDPTVTPIDVTVYVSTVTLYDSLLVTSDPDPADLFIGETAQLTVEGVSICDPLLTADLTADPATSYVSDDEDELIATVDAMGMITAVGAGSVIITVSRDDGSTLEVIDVPVTVTIAPLEATVAITSGDDDGDGIVLPGDEIGLDVVVTGGTPPYRFDWDVDATDTTDDTLGDGDVFDDQTSQTPTFTPPLGVEGTYVITCIVLDDLGAEVTPALSIIATTLTAEPAVEGNDGCIVGLPSDDVPLGAEGPGTLQAQFHERMLLANASGGVDVLTYEWTADLSGFVEPNVETPQWIVTRITEETMVTFTVTISDGLVTLPFAVPWIVSPPVELSAIQFESPAVELEEFPITLIRVEDAGQAPRSFRFPNLPVGVTVGEECNGGLATTFDDVELEATCLFMFDTDGEYTLTVDVLDDCSLQTQDSPKPIVSYEFIVTVVDP